MLAMFFNPFGFDVLFKMALDFTGSYWKATGIFYCLAGVFFGLYFYFSGNNPIKVIVNHFKTKVCQLRSRLKKK